ncbi:MAG: ribonuclease HII [Thermaerobacter sp.]|nr:ribonuclease HII [Thermaerobacter sp.]
MACEDLPAQHAVRSAEIREWGYRLLCGIDEVGRGALAGPVAAGAVVLDQDLGIAGVDDSKRLSPLQRRRLAPRIRSRAVAAAVGYAAPREIDRIGIVRATQLAMHRALARLGVQPDHLLLDAFLLPGTDLPQIARAKGDQLYAEIAAASILAKVERDALMQRIAQEFPAYGWQQNKGYGAPEHLAAIAEHGLTPWHRQTFCQNCRPTAAGE